MADIGKETCCALRNLLLPGLVGSRHQPFLAHWDPEEWTLDHMEIMNDGATILKLLDIVHLAAKTLINIAGLRSEWTTWMVAKVDGGQGQVEWERTATQLWLSRSCPSHSNNTICMYYYYKPDSVDSIHIF